MSFTIKTTLLGCLVAALIAASARSNEPAPKPTGVRGTDTRVSLKMVSSRGTKVFPPTGAITDTLDHWRARFITRENPGDLPDEDVNQLLVKISRRHKWMHIEKLQEFDGELGFTRDQGEN